MRTHTRPSTFARLRGLMLALALLLAPLLGLATGGTAQAASGDCTTSGVTVTCTFDYSGAAQTWTAPAGVTEATFDLYGAQGQNVFCCNIPRSVGGKGGRVRATLVVVPGATYQVLVGGRNRFNGGGWGRGVGANGGGASDVRSGTFGLADRLLVAGGGGGGSTASNRLSGSVNGGAGGYPNGGGGEGWSGGGGGTQSGGGAGGPNEYGGISASPGSLGQGGDGGEDSYALSGDGGGGGGGGYYGGGGGGGGVFSGSGGGGGSS
jgi:hypothetical protein